MSRAAGLGLAATLVTFDSARRNLDDALREADGLLYQAKRAGKGQVRHGTMPGRP